MAPSRASTPADYVLRALEILGVLPPFDPDELLHSQLKGTLNIVSQPVTTSLRNSFLAFSG